MDRLRKGEKKGKNNFTTFIYIFLEIFAMYTTKNKNKQINKQTKLKYF